MLSQANGGTPGSTFDVDQVLARAREIEQKRGRHTVGTAVGQGGHGRHNANSGYREMNMESLRGRALANSFSQCLFMVHQCTNVPVYP